MNSSVGTFEPAESEIVRRERTARSRSGRGRPSGGSDGGNNGGDDGGDYKAPRIGNQDHDAEPRDKSRILTAFLLLVVLMTFGGLIGAYVVVATNRAAEWRPFSLPIQVWISTIILAASSITYEVGRRAVDRSNTDSIRRWMITTAVLGGIFIASQLLVWMTLVSRGFYLQGNPYAGFFYILTAIHAIHVIGGIIALGAVLLRSWHPTEREAEGVYRANLAKSVGWYWHFMGGLWIVLFLVLGFWK